MTTLLGILRRKVGCSGMEEHEEGVCLVTDFDTGCGEWTHTMATGRNRLVDISWVLMITNCPEFGFQG